MKELYDKLEIHEKGYTAVYEYGVEYDDDYGTPFAWVDLINLAHESPVQNPEFQLEQVDEKALREACSRLGLPY